MGLRLWNELPHGLLKKKQEGWSRLDYDVQLLIIELARIQGYKCVHCSQTRNLIIEHDHYPKHGSGDKITIYNIRGLVCGPCNWHIGMHEAEERGEYSNWPDRFPRVSESQYWGYIYAYENRVYPLIEAADEQRLGSLNYWRRRNFLSKFDEWCEWEGMRKKRYPWYWGFDEIKDKKYGYFRTHKRTLHFFRTVAACAKYFREQEEKDTEYQPPDEFLELMFRLRPLMESIRPVLEAKLSAMGGGEEIKGTQGQANPMADN